VIAVSESARGAYLATGWDEPERVVVVHNGVAGTPRPGAGASVRRELGVPANAPVIAMVSTLRPEKGHRVALRAFAALRERFPAASLVVVGDGPLLGELEEHARAIGQSVLMTGYRDDVMAVLDAADMLLHPSHTDAFPTTLLEAMAASVPIVATAVGGIPEIVRDGQEALLVGPPPTAPKVAAALDRLLADADLRRRLGAAGRARFERHFTLRRWVQQTRAVYDDVVAEART
jgi:glycosyltransferase involved in cell wall biosynthesis